LAIRENTALAVLAGAVILAALLSTPAQAVTLNGGDSAHRRAVEEVIDRQPQLLALVESVWPNFSVRVCFGGRAWEGSIDVDQSKPTMAAFKAQVGHEMAHEVQRAADAKGLGMGAAWLALLTAEGYPSSTWVWSERAPTYGAYHPWEALAENIRRSFYAESHSTPRTQLAWPSRAAMEGFLADVGVTP
jgi:hypothetical protein